MNVRIGDARDVCTTELARLHAEAFDRGWSESEIAEILALPIAIGLVAFAANEPAGLLLGWVSGAEAEILTMAVAPSRRRAGLGRGLLGAALPAIQSRGAAAVFLEVREDNLAARSLYAQTGFVEVGRRPGYYSGTDAIVLRRNLNNH